MAIATWMRTAPRSVSKRNLALCICPPARVFASLAAAAVGRRRSIDRSDSAIEPSTQVISRRKEAPRKCWQRWNFVRIERTNQPRRDQHQQLRAFLAVGLALEQMSDNWQLAEKRDRCRVHLRGVVDQAGDGERLTIAQFHLRLCPARCQSRNAESFECDAVIEVELAHFRTYLQPNQIAGNRRREIQPDTELFKHDGHLTD